MVKSKENESKNEKFIRLGEKRTSLVLKGLDVLENLVSSQYESTKSERDEIINAIEKKLEKLKIAFSTEKKEKERAFVFSN